MKLQVQNMVGTCAICMKNKSDYLQLTGLLQPLSFLYKSGQIFFMDFVDDFPSSHGKTMLLMVVDQFSKDAHFLLLSHSHITIYSLPLL